jgi:HPt (histidine-containing phosphotransfer) domain-containing protein
MRDDDTILIRANSVSGRLLPAFLARRVRDLALIKEALPRNEFSAIERLGHNLKGIGRSYGFDAISDIGAVIEDACRRRDAEEVRSQAAALARYLQRVRIVPP